MSSTPFEESYGRSLVVELRGFPVNTDWVFRAVVEDQVGPAEYGARPRVVWYGVTRMEYHPRGRNPVGFGGLGGRYRAFDWVTREGIPADAATAQLLDKAVCAFQEEKDRAQRLPKTHPDRLAFVARLCRDLWGDP